MGGGRRGKRLQAPGHYGAPLANGIKGVFTLEMDFCIVQIVYESHVLIL